jgi:hypothetical protein
LPASHAQKNNKKSNQVFPLAVYGQIDLRLRKQQSFQKTKVKPARGNLSKRIKKRLGENIDFLNPPSTAGNCDAGVT